MAVHLMLMYKPFCVIRNLKNRGKFEKKNTKDTSLEKQCIMNIMENDILFFWQICRIQFFLFKEAGSKPYLSIDIRPRGSWQSATF